MDSGADILYDTPEHQRLRRDLARKLAQKGNISEEILAAIEKVPRHFFIPGSVTPQEAYADKARPIGEGQTISQPYTVAFQTQLLEVQAGHKILEVGTGSGYQTAILTELGADVFTIEYNQALYRKTEKLLSRLGYAARIFYGDGSEGLPEHAPFDRILVTASAPKVPETLLRQLREGGKLVIPVGEPGMQRMVRATRKNAQQFDTETIGWFSFVPLLGKHGWK
jgi:protein-L-isoaspartate(D-aspartate) O-methyltransferase